MFLQYNNFMKMPNFIFTVKPSHYSLYSYFKSNISLLTHLIVYIKQNNEQTANLHYPHLSTRYHLTRCFFTSNVVLLTIKSSTTKSDKTWPKVSLHYNFLKIYDTAVCIKLIPTTVTLSFNWLSYLTLSFNWLSCLTLSFNWLSYLTLSFN